MLSHLKNENSYGNASLGIGLPLEPLVVTSSNGSNIYGFEKHVSSPQDSDTGHWNTVPML